MNIRRSIVQTKRAFLTSVILSFLAIDPAGSAEIKPAAGSFPAFWAQFNAAVQKRDKEAVARMTKFPFMGQYRSKADFIKGYALILDERTRRCFSKAKPIKDDGRDSYSVFCGEEIYGFSKVEGEYRFTDIGMND
jgi:hypothetical protein